MSFSKVTPGNGANSTRVADEDQMQSRNGNTHKLADEDEEVPFVPETRCCVTDGDDTKLPVRDRVAKSVHC